MRQVRARFACGVLVQESWNLPEPPFELRRLVAFRADVLTAVARIFYKTVSADYRRRSGLASARTGAVTCVQRFGGSLNLNPHLHVIWLDGIFTFDDGTAHFHSADPPSSRPSRTHRASCGPVARGILSKSGYHVVEARNAGEALLHSEKHPGTIHLLLSDVVMPQMSGP